MNKVVIARKAVFDEGNVELFSVEGYDDVKFSKK